MTVYSFMRGYWKCMVCQPKKELVRLCKQLLFLAFPTQPRWGKKGDIGVSGEELLQFLKVRGWLKGSPNEGRTRYSDTSPTSSPTSSYT